MYLSNEKFTCPKEQIMLKTLSSYFADTMHKLFKNRMKSDIKTIENSVYPDQLASK